MEELDKIIKNLKEINRLTGLKVSDDVVFENTVKIYISDRINDSKKERLPNNFMSKLKNEQNPILDSSKPSDKQISFLKKNKIQIPNTRKEAIKLINDFIEKNRI